MYGPYYINTSQIPSELSHVRIMSLLRRARPSDRFKARLKKTHVSRPDFYKKESGRAVFCYLCTSQLKPPPFGSRGRVGDNRGIKSLLNNKLSPEGGSFD